MTRTLFFLCILLSHFTNSQEITFTSPVKIPIFLSGSFAELRNNHFHSGIDIKTQGVSGIPVYAIAEGYISRIVVSPVGFGLALYITHPNGTTSVYGHLNNFRPDIASYVKDIQYERESFRVDLPVPAGRFPVKGGELIAHSGNSGSSGGPHLHFEIRDSKTEEPLNPLRYPFPVTDNIPPKIYALMVSPLNEHGHIDNQAEKKIYPVVLENGTYTLQEKAVIPAWGMVGLAVETNDFFDGSNNRCGIYSLRMYWDGDLFYAFQMDRFSFDESRYINSHIDYETYDRSNRRFHKTWIDPGNRLRIYDYVREAGALRVTDGNIHPVTIEITDLQGNRSVLNFKVVSRYGQAERRQEPFQQPMRQGVPNRFRGEGIRVDLPAEALYTDTRFRWKSRPGATNLRSPLHIVHATAVPLHQSMTLSIQPQQLSEFHAEKALLVRVDTLTGKLSAAGGAYKEGWVTGSISTFGNYAVALDTVPPAIVPLSIRDQSAITETGRLRFRITDDLSGIGSYRATIDGQWALFEYDAKTNMLIHTFDADRFELGKRHQINLEVIDNKGNRSSYEATFWK